MTGLHARIGEGLAGFRDELPIITGRVQRQLKYSKGGRITHFAVRSHRSDGGVIGAAGPDNKFADAIGLVQPGGGSLWCKAFIDMVMPV